MTRPIVWLALPCLVLAHGVLTASPQSAPAPLQAAAPSGHIESWRNLRVSVAPTPPEELATREALLPPGTVSRPGLASPTRSPWVNANGWRFIRNPSGRFVSDVPSGKGALAVAEAYAYGADAFVKIAADDLTAVQQMLGFFKGLPDVNLSPLADFGVVDDGTPEMGEVMNLLVRRNLLFERLSAPASRFAVNVKLGAPEYPREKAADPSAFALAIRRRLTDEKRSLRLFGSEVVIARVIADGSQARVHLINYGGRNLEGLRVRVHGTYQSARAYIAGSEDRAVTEQVVADGATEFSMPRMSIYAVVDVK